MQFDQLLDDIQPEVQTAVLAYWDGGASTHTEATAPLPPGSKFWVEVEPPTGETFSKSFDLKVQ